MVWATLFCLFFSIYGHASWENYAQAERSGFRKPDQYVYVGEYLVDKWSEFDDHQKKEALHEAITLYLSAGKTSKPRKDIANYDRKDPVFGDYFHPKERKVLQFFSMAGLTYKDNWQGLFTTIFTVWAQLTSQKKAYDLQGPMKDKMTKHIGILLEAISLGRFVVDNPCALHKLPIHMENSIFKNWEKKSNIMRFATQAAALGGISNQLGENHWFKDALSLVQYLKHPAIPEEVKKLADIGVKNYQKKPELKNLREKAEKLHENYGGRKNIPNKKWLEITFDKTEEEIKKIFTKIDPPKPYSVRVIQTVFDALTKVKNEKAVLHLVKGFGVSYIANLKNPGTLQVASQSDYRESPGAYRVDVTNYISDPTQGPNASIDAAAGAVHRNAAEEAGTLPNALHKVLTPDIHYSQGYLELAENSEEELNKWLLKLKKDIGLLEVLPQWVVYETTGTIGLQIFTAAPSFQTAPTPKEGSAAAEICKILVSNQYKASTQITVIQAILQGNKTPLNLTLVGQGAFNNNQSAIDLSLHESLKASAGQNVDVFVHAFREDAQQIANDTIKALHKGLKDQEKIDFVVKKWNQEDFINTFGSEDFKKRAIKIG